MLGIVYYGDNNLSFFLDMTSVVYGNNNQITVYPIFRNVLSRKSCREKKRF